MFCYFIQAKELETLSGRSADQVAEIRKLRAVVQYISLTFVWLFDAKEISYYHRD